MGIASVTDLRCMGSSSRSPLISSAMCTKSRISNVQADTPTKSHERYCTVTHRHRPQPHPHTKFSIDDALVDHHLVGLNNSISYGPSLLILHIPELLFYLIFIPTSCGFRIHSIEEFCPNTPDLKLITAIMSSLPKSMKALVSLNLSGVLFFAPPAPHQLKTSPESS